MIAATAVTPDRPEFSMSDSDVRIAPGSGELATASEPPRKLFSPMLSLEIRVNGDWQGMRVTQLYWDDQISKFVMDGEYTNSTPAYQVCEGRVRMLCVGRPVLEFPGTDPMAMIPGATITARCPFAM